MSHVDVRLSGVGKQYRLGARRGSDTFWALRDVTLDIHRGASVGIIGRNGADLRQGPHRDQSRLPVVDDLRQFPG